MPHVSSPCMSVRRSKTGFFVLTVLIIALVASAGCSRESPASPSPYSGTYSTPVTSIQAPEEAPAHLAVRVDSLSEGDPLPAAYTCTGTSESPPVSWSGIPPGTKSLVLILEDPDAPQGTFTHWLVYNIPPAPGGLERGQPYAKVLQDGSQQGTGSSGERGYYPPCPPPGPIHRYIFRLYALDWYPALPAADRAAIDNAIDGHMLATAEFTTTFRR